MQTLREGLRFEARLRYLEGNRRAKLHLVQVSVVHVQYTLIRVKGKCTCTHQYRVLDT